MKPRSIARTAVDTRSPLEQRLRLCLTSRDGERSQRRQVVHGHQRCRRCQVVRNEGNLAASRRILHFLASQPGGDDVKPSCLLRPATEGRKAPRGERNHKISLPTGSSRSRSQESRRIANSMSR